MLLLYRSLGLDSEATLGLLKLLREVKRSMPKTFRCLMTSSIVQSHSLPADVFQGIFRVKAQIRCGSESVMHFRMD